MCVLVRYITVLQQVYAVLTKAHVLRHRTQDSGSNAPLPLKTTYPMHLLTVATSQGRSEGRLVQSLPVWPLSHQGPLFAHVPPSACPLLSRPPANKEVVDLLKVSSDLLSKL